MSVVSARIAVVSLSVTSSRWTPLASRTDVGERASESWETGAEDADMNDPLAVHHRLEQRPRCGLLSSNAEKIRRDYVRPHCCLFLPHSDRARRIVTDDRTKFTPRQASTLCSLRGYAPFSQRSSSGLISRG